MIMFFKGSRYGHRDKSVIRSVTTQGSPRNLEKVEDIFNHASDDLFENSFRFLIEFPHVTTFSLRHCLTLFFVCFFSLLIFENMMIFHL